MKNLKKYLIFALCLALAFSALAALAGCSNEAAEEESGAAEQQSDAGTPEEQIAAIITAYFDGINEGDRTKLAPGLPKSVPLTMGEDYDTMLKELLGEEQDRVKTVAGKGGKVTCTVNAVTAITDEEEFSLQAQGLQEMYALGDVTAIYEAEIERVYTDASGAEVRRATEEPLIVMAAGEWLVFMA